MNNLLYGIIIPNNCAMPFEAVWSWMNSPRFPIIKAQGGDLDFNRNMVWKQALKYQEFKPSHLLFIDYDIVFTPEDVQKVQTHLDSGLDAVGGVYVNKDKQPYVFERIENDYQLTPLKEGLNEVDACGTGFLAINMNVMDKLPENPFEDMKEGELFHGEDISFCHKLKKQGFKLWMDSEIKVGHVRNTVIYGN